MSKREDQYVRVWTDVGIGFGGLIFGILDFE